MSSPEEGMNAGEDAWVTSTVRRVPTRGFRTAVVNGPLGSESAAPVPALGRVRIGAVRWRSRIVAPLMRPTRGLSALLVTSLLALAPPARAAWHALEEIPVESQVYKWVDDLASSYPLNRGLMLTRPWTRAELGEFLDQLVADQPEAARDPVVHRLRRELEPEGGLRGGLEPLGQVDEDDASLEVSPYARVGYAEDRARSLVARDERVGAQVSAAFGGYGLIFADAYVGPASPGAHGTPDASGRFDSGSTDLTAWYDRVYATWATRGFSVKAGHTWLRWGPGATGTLALSDAAPAFDLIQMTARFGKHAEFSWCVGSLDPAAETYLSGHRLDLRLGRSVEVAFSGLARFNGAGNAALYLIPVAPLPFMERRVRGSGSSTADSLENVRSVNVLYSGDFSWTWRPGIRLYGELMLDDITLDHSRPLRAGWQGGAEIRRAGTPRSWTARLDYSRVYRYTYASAEGIDFIHAGFPTGYYLGPDVDQWSGRFEWRWGAGWTWGVEGFATRKGAGALGESWQPGTPVPNAVLTYPVDHDTRAAATAEWSPSPSWTVSGVVGQAKVEALGNVVGNDHSGAYGSARATLRW